MDYGIVYLLTNPCMPGLVKIGMTAQEDIDKRMKELYTTGVPIPFECQFACRVKNTDCAKIEKALHTAFAPQRVNANREFFRIQVEQAKAILELFHHEDVTESVTDEIENDLTEEDKVATKKAQVHRPALNFFEMGMQKNDVLHWKEDPSIIAATDQQQASVSQKTSTYLYVITRQGDVAKTLSAMEGTAVASIPNEHESLKDLCNRRFPELEKDNLTFVKFTCPIEGFDKELTKDVMGFIYLKNRKYLDSNYAPDYQRLTISEIAKEFHIDEKTVLNVISNGYFLTTKSTYPLYDVHDENTIAMVV